MKSDDKRPRIIQAMTLLLCASVASITIYNLEPSEFSGGQLTGPLLRLHNIGLYLFVLALAVTFRFLRVGAGIAFAAAICAVPLYLYLTAPGIFNYFQTSEPSIPTPPAFVWNKLAVAGIATTVIAASGCLRSLLINRTTNGME